MNHSVSACQRDRKCVCVVCCGCVVACCLRTPLAIGRLVVGSARDLGQLLGLLGLRQCAKSHGFDLSHKRGPKLCSLETMTSSINQPSSAQHRSVECFLDQILEETTDQMRNLALVRSCREYRKNWDEPKVARDILHTHLVDTTS
jgi:hypothetical protein